MTFPPGSITRLLLSSVESSSSSRGFAVVSALRYQTRGAAFATQRLIGPAFWHIPDSDERQAPANDQDVPSQQQQRPHGHATPSREVDAWSETSHRSFAEAGLYRHPTRHLYPSQHRHYASGASPGTARGATPSGSAVKKKAADAADCDTALGDYVDLQHRLANLKRPSTLKSWDQVVRDAAGATWSMTKSVLQFLVSVPGRLWALRNLSRAEWGATLSRWWKIIKEEGHHYWVGTKLLGYDIKIATRLALKAARGRELSRRERRQLTRTTADIFRLVPMIVILVIPFMELALPVLLKLFPNMLPSTYEDKLKKEESLKRSLVARLEVARFLQDTVAEMAADLSKRGTGRTSATANELMAFIKKVRSGEPVENSDILRFSQLFNDELTLDNLERVQLVTMCQFVGISPFGTDQFLRTRLRAHLQKIKADDYAIEQEGLENLSDDELRGASRARGMQAFYGEGAPEHMRRKLQDWLDLSLHRGLPSSLLLLSRAFTITAGFKTDDRSAIKDATYSKLKETLSVMPEEVVDAVESDRAVAEGHGAEAAEAKLELIKREEELIKEEQEAQASVETSERKRAAAGAAALAALAQATATVTTEQPHGASAAAAAAALDEDHDGAPLSAEERAAKIEEFREKKINSIVAALGDFMNRSGVAKERGVFLDLVQNEVQRLNKHISEQTGPSSSLVFTGAGLKTSGGAAPGPPAADNSAVSAASKRVSKMLQRIEKELDSAEVSIGNRLHVLDLDGDGLVSREELAQALAVLRENLSDEDLQLLYSKLGGAAAAAGPDGGSAILVTHLLSHAGRSAVDAGATPISGSPDDGVKERKEPSSGDPAVAQEAARAQSSSIHTR